MTSVTRRITEYNHEVGQSRGGLLPLRLFALEQLDDDLGAIDHKLEILPGGSVGTAVDYLTRLGLLKSDAGEESWAATMVDVFGVSITGAMRISEQTEHTSAAADARSALWELGSVQDDHGAVSFVVDETAVRVACQLATYDVGLRAGVQFYNPQSTLLTPDDFTTSHILAMVDRARAFFEKHGPITRDGFIWL